MSLYQTSHSAASVEGNEQIPTTPYTILSANWERVFPEDSHPEVLLAKHGIKWITPDLNTMRLTRLPYDQVRARLNPETRMTQSLHSSMPAHLQHRNVFTTDGVTLNKATIQRKCWGDVYTVHEDAAQLTWPPLVFRNGETHNPGSVVSRMSGLMEMEVNPICLQTSDALVGRPALETQTVRGMVDAAMEDFQKQGIRITRQAGSVGSVFMLNQLFARMKPYDEEITTQHSQFLTMTLTQETYAAQNINFADAQPGEWNNYDPGSMTEGSFHGSDGLGHLSLPIPKSDGSPNDGLIITRDIQGAYEIIVDSVDMVLHIGDILSIEHADDVVNRIEVTVTKMWNDAEDAGHMVIGITEPIHVGQGALVRYYTSAQAPAQADTRVVIGAGNVGPASNSVTAAEMEMGVNGGLAPQNMKSNAPSGVITTIDAVIEHLQLAADVVSINAVKQARAAGYTGQSITEAYEFQTRPSAEGTIMNNCLLGKILPMNPTADNYGDSGTVGDVLRTWACTAAGNHDDNIWEDTNAGGLISEQWDTDHEGTPDDSRNYDCTDYHDLKTDEDGALDPPDADEWTYGSSKLEFKLPTNNGFNESPYETLDMKKLLFADCSGFTTNTLMKVIGQLAYVNGASTSPNRDDWFEMGVRGVDALYGIVDMSNSQLQTRRAVVWQRGNDPACFSGVFGYNFFVHQKLVEHFSLPQASRGSTGSEGELPWHNGAEKSFESAMRAASVRRDFGGAGDGGATSEVDGGRTLEELVIHALTQDGAQQGMTALSVARFIKKHPLPGDAPLSGFASGVMAITPTLTALAAAGSVITKPRSGGKALWIASEELVEAMRDEAHHYRKLSLNQEMWGAESMAPSSDSNWGVESMESGSGSGKQKENASPGDDKYAKGSAAAARQFITLLTNTINSFNRDEWDRYHFMFFKGAEQVVQDQYTSSKGPMGDHDMLKQIVHGSEELHRLSQKQIVSKLTLTVLALKEPIVFTEQEVVNMVVSSVHWEDARDDGDGSATPEPEPESSQARSGLADVDLRDESRGHFLCTFPMWAGVNMATKRSRTVMGNICNVVVPAMREIKREGASRLQTMELINAMDAKLRSTCDHLTGRYGVLDNVGKVGDVQNGMLFKDWSEYLADGSFLAAWVAGSNLGAHFHRAWNEPWNNKCRKQTEYLSGISDCITHLEPPWYGHQRPMHDVSEYPIGLGWSKLVSWGGLRSVDFDALDVHEESIMDHNNPCLPGLHFGGLGCMDLGGYLASADTQIVDSTFADRLLPDVKYGVTFGHVVNARSSVRCDPDLIRFWWQNMGAMDRKMAMFWGLGHPLMSCKNLSTFRTIAVPKFSSENHFWWTLNKLITNRQDGKAFKDWGVATHTLQVDAGVNWSEMSLKGIFTATPPQQSDLERWCFGTGSEDDKLAHSRVHRDSMAMADLRFIMCMLWTKLYEGIRTLPGIALAWARTGDIDSPMLVAKKRNQVMGMSGGVNMPQLDSSSLDDAPTLDVFGNPQPGAGAIDRLRFTDAPNFATVNGFITSNSVMRPMLAGNILGAGETEDKAPGFIDHVEVGVLANDFDRGAMMFTEIHRNGNEIFADLPMGEGRMWAPKITPCSYVLAANNWALFKTLSTTGPPGCMPNYTLIQSMNLTASRTTLGQQKHTLHVSSQTDLIVAKSTHQKMLPHLINLWIIPRHASAVIYGTEAPTFEMKPEMTGGKQFTSCNAFGGAAKVLETGHGLVTLTENRKVAQRAYEMADDVYVRKPDVDAMDFDAFDFTAFKCDPPNNQTQDLYRSTIPPRVASPFWAQIYGNGGIHEGAMFVRQLAPAEMSAFPLNLPNPNGPDWKLLGNLVVGMELIGRDAAGRANDGVRMKTMEPLVPKIEYRPAVGGNAGPAGGGSAGAPKAVTTEEGPPE